MKMTPAGLLTQIKKLRLGAPLVLVAVLGVCAGLVWAQAVQKAPSHIGSDACAGCHQDEARHWKTSHHAWAWKLPSVATVKGDFENATITHKGVTSRFTSRDQRFFVETDGYNGRTREFEVRATAGIEPLQQYLVEVEAGRLQALDLAWDTVNRRWYHLYPEQHLEGGNGLHWTGPYKNWNARCAECHATGFAKNYDARARRYFSQQAEIGVGCEACHGPGEAHVAWAKAPRQYDPKAWRGLTARGLTIGFSHTSPETEIQQCAGCHARREPFGDTSPVPGTPFHDAYRLALLRPGLYHADGSIQDEVYVYGSFLQSKMYAKGVRCSDCHNPHSAKLQADGNMVCTQCHSAAGNARFPTLRKADYDNASHHFHKLGGDAANCKSCHMIERTYMGVDGRRDHSFRIPRPDLSPKTGAPNACTDCHKSKGPEWAAREIAKHFPNSRKPKTHFSKTFSEARLKPSDTINELLEIARDKAQPAIIRATALDLLGAVADKLVASRTARFVTDQSPLVRVAAINLQRGAAPADRVLNVSPALSDAFLSVRIAAARALLATDISELSADRTALLRRADREWRQSLLAKTDFPETQVVIGGLALSIRNVDAAESAFNEAVRQDPQLVRAWVMLAQIAIARRNLTTAMAVIRDALRVNPGNEILERFERELEAVRTR